jgi:hypothetical protein
MPDTVTTAADKIHAARLRATEQQRLRQKPAQPTSYEKFVASSATRGTSWVKTAKRGRS